jgi:signal recognition particle subunit SRP68
MQLRQEANTEPRKKFHLISRLRKASTYALQLQTLCEVTVFLYQMDNQTPSITLLMPVLLLHAVQEFSHC